MDESSKGRKPIPGSEKKWFGNIITYLLKESGVPQIDFAVALDVSRSWVTRAKSGHFGPWTKTVFEEKLNTLVESGYISEEKAQNVLSEFSFSILNARKIQFVYLHHLLFSSDLNLAVPDQYAFQSAENLTEDDFIQRNVLERKEVSEICKAINRGRRFVLLVGPQASGKSMTATNVIYKLTKESYAGYLLHTKDITDSARHGIAAEIAMVNDRRCVLLIEDAHINPRVVNHFIESLLDMQINCIVTSRPSYTQQLLWGQRNLLGQIENNKLGQFFRFDTQCPSFTHFMERLIYKGFKKNSGMLPQSVIDRLITESGGDLWALRFLIESADKLEIDWPKVYSNFHIRLSELERQQPFAAVALIVIASFWQYEIPVPGLFLTNALKLPRDAVYYLADRGYVLYDSHADVYFQHHASISEHYYRTTLEYKHLWGGIIPQEHHASAIVFLAQKYLEFDRLNIYQFFRHTRYDPDLMGECLENASILETLSAEFSDQNEGLAMAADLISDISLYASKETRSSLYGLIDLKSLKEKLDGTNDVSALAYFIEGLTWDTKNGWQETVNMVNRSAIVVGSRSLDGKDRRLVYCPFTAPFSSLTTIKRELTNIIDTNQTIHDKDKTENSLLSDALLCCKSGEVPTICLKGTLHTPGKLAIDVVQSLDQDTLAKKLISPDTSLLHVAKLLSVIAWNNRTVFKGLVKKIGIEQMLKKLKSVRSSEDRNMFLWSLQQADPFYFEDKIWPLIDQETHEKYARTGWVRQ